MPMHNPAFPPGPYRFVNREYLVITYRTDPELLQKILPAPLKMTEPVVKYEFINMPDSTGFGHYCESGQVIPVTLDGVAGGYVHSMYLNDHPPIAAGRELWGFPKKLRRAGIARAQGYPDRHAGLQRFPRSHRHHGLSSTRAWMPPPSRSRWKQPCFLLKVIPHVDGTPRICELVQYSLTDVVIKGAWGGPGGLELNPHALAPVADAAGAGSIICSAYHGRPDPAVWQGRPRLPQPIEIEDHIMLLKDKVALITGAASGIGKEIAFEYARQGAKVVIADMALEAATATANEIVKAGGTAMAVAMNVTDEAQVDKGVAEAVAAYGGMDVLISNAGIQIISPLVDLSYDNWKKMLAIHLDGAFLTTRACMRADDRRRPRRLRYLYGFGPFARSLAAEGALCRGQARIDRPGQGGRQGRAPSTGSGRT